MAKKRDEELFEMFQSGDAAAFEQLFTRYKGPIFTFLLRQCGNRETASDLTQDVFTKIILKPKSFSYQSKFSTWLYTVARNAAVDWARKASHRRHDSLDQDYGEGPALGERIEGKSPDPDRAAESADIKEAIVRALEKLPEEQREVFVLREYQGVPFAEIAEIVGVKAGTVKSRMRYALERMRKFLHEYEQHAKELS